MGKISIGTTRTCDCSPNHLSCIAAKEWMKCQLGVWQFNYEGRDIRDKQIHPATFPIALARRCIDLFTHRGELVLDPFVGSGTTLVAARDAGRNAVGFDLHSGYIELCLSRLNSGAVSPKALRLALRDDTIRAEQPRLLEEPEQCHLPQQLAIQNDARNISEYLDPGSVSLIVTSPPYANLLNRRRRNKSRRSDQRRNPQYLKIEQYSSDPRDLGTLPLEQYAKEMGNIFASLLPLLRPRAHCVINVPDMWWEDERITIHLALVDALRRAGYQLRNIIIWDRTNIVNRVGIFGWPNNYITMGTTFEYLLDFRRPKD